MKGKAAKSTENAYFFEGKMCGKEVGGWLVDVDSADYTAKKTSDSDDGGGSSRTPLGINPGKRHRKQPVMGDILRAAADKADVDEEGSETIAPIQFGDMQKKSVLIIGAGMSGLAAGHHLQKRGFNVTILEARDRIGGRVHTDWTLGTAVDLGATFIHGTLGNPLTDVAVAEGVNLYTPSEMHELRRENGKPVSVDTDTDVGSGFKALVEGAEELSKTTEADVSLGVMFERLMEYLPFDPSTGRHKDVMHWYVANLEMPNGAKVHKLSAKHWDLDFASQMKGSHDIIRDGYSTLTHGLARDLKIVKGAVVREVQHDVPVLTPNMDMPNTDTPDTPAGDVEMVGRNGVADDVVLPGAVGAVAAPAEIASVETAVPLAAEVGDGPGATGKPEVEPLTPRRKSVYRGRRGDASRKPVGVRVITKGGEEFIAEHVINTIPLGVLKTGNVIFSPQLPKEKLAAIEDIGFGLLNKVALRFETPFWHDIPIAEAKAKGVEPGPPSDYVGFVSKEHGKYFMFLSLYRATSTPVLVALTSGSHAYTIERNTDFQVVSEAIKCLSKMFGLKEKDSRTRLVDYKVTRWASDQYARGSYSYAAVGTTPEHFLKMAEPVGTTLLFAGEATNRTHPSTVHGAFLSGTREAKRVIRMSEIDAAKKERLVKEILAVEEPLKFKPQMRANGNGAKPRRGRGGGQAGSSRNPRGTGKRPGGANGDTRGGKRQRSSNGRGGGTRGAARGGGRGGRGGSRGANGGRAGSVNGNGRPKRGNGNGPKPRSN